MDSTNINAPGPLKSRLLALVAQGQAEQQTFIAQLTPAERASLGAPDAWAAKDHVAHNAAWKADAAHEISAALHGEAYLPESTTVFNPRLFAEQQHQSWDAILTDVEQTDEKLRAAIEACSEAELTDPQRFPWREGLPLWCTALVSGYEHPAEHYAQFYLESGDLERATAIRQDMVETARRFISDREEFGYIVYNLGCFFAQTGQPGQAITAIRESFASAPELREGIRQDPELASLRDDFAFQALVAEQTDAGAPRASATE